MITAFIIIVLIILGYKIRGLQKQLYTLQEQIGSCNIKILSLQRFIKIMKIDQEYSDKDLDDFMKGVK